MNIKKTVLSAGAVLQESGIIKGNINGYPHVASFISSFSPENWDWSKVDSKSDLEQLIGNAIPAKLRSIA